MKGISKEELFNMMTDSFRENNPKFPWPKKHDLDDQTDEFKLAFAQIHDAVDMTIRLRQTEEQERREDMFQDMLTKKDKHLESIRDSRDFYYTRYTKAHGWNVFMLGLLAVVLFVSILALTSVENIDPCTMLAGLPRCS